MNEQRYETLKAGDERRKGDEVRHLNVATNESVDYFPWFINEPPKLGSWTFVQLLGHPILAADLMVAEFRRPLPF